MADNGESAYWNAGLEPVVAVEVVAVIVIAWVHCYTL